MASRSLRCRTTSSGSTMRTWRPNIITTEQNSQSNGHPREASIGSGAMASPPTTRPMSGQGSLVKSPSHGRWGLWTTSPSASR